MHHSATISSSEYVRTRVNVEFKPAPTIIFSTLKPPTLLDFARWGLMVLANLPPVYLVHEAVCIAPTTVMHPVSRTNRRYEGISKGQDMNK